MASPILKVGIAGYGAVGKRRRFFIDRHPNLKTVAVCDQVLETDGTFQDGVRFYRSFKDLISRESLDAVFVCLTNDVASEATCLGLERGMHVFCEKPPGRNLDEIARVIVTERAHPGLKLKYGFNHRYHDSVRDALRLLQKKELGEIINLRAVYGKSKLVTYGQSDWRTRREVAGGGILLDQGIHMVDLLRLFAGDFSEINSFISKNYWQHDVEDNAYALMRTPSGVVAMLHSSATQWRHRFHLDISLTKGAISLSGILSGSKSYGEESITVAHSGANDQGIPREQTTRYNEDNSWRDEIDEFTDAILSDHAITNGCSAEAYKTMELVYRIYCADVDWRKNFNLTDKPTFEI